MKFDLTTGRRWLIMVSMAILPATCSLAATTTTDYARPVTPNSHGLIMVIGNYPAPIPPLQGVMHDVDSATEIAHRLGVPDVNLTVYRDEQLTLKGMRKALTDFAERVQPNDLAFIYFSGHGGRSKAIEEIPGDRCAASLIAYDGFGLHDVELGNYIKRLSGRAQKVVTLIDSCHSGGFATRGKAKPPSGFTAKFWDGLPNREDACSIPTNVVMRSIALGAKEAGNGGNNLVYITAARADELSFDEASRGGLATQAWLKCLRGDARDLDRSGGLSAEEVRQCAQLQLDTRMKDVNGLLPSHVTIAGNPDMVLGYATKSVEAPQPVAAVTVGPATNAASPTSSSTKMVPAPLATLKDIYANRDDRRVVSIQLAKPTLRIGKDAVDFTLTSSDDGYLYLLMVGSDGTTYDLLFPNTIDRNNFIKAGEAIRLPRKSWELVVQGPAGRDTLLAIVSDSPRDFAAIGQTAAGPFSVINAVASKDIQLVTGAPAKTNDVECNEARRTRNIGVLRRCSNAYGAALFAIDEVEK